MERLLLEIQRDKISEFLYAERVSENTARIISIPFCGNELGPGDIVKFVDKKIIEVLEKNVKVQHVLIGAEFNEVNNYFVQFGIGVESLGEIDTLVRYGLAIPKGVEIKEILENAPWTIICDPSFDLES